MIPILYNHNPEQIIGSLSEGNVVTLRVKYALTHKQIREIFGNIGYHVLKEEKEGIYQFKILEWSL